MFTVFVNTFCIGIPIFPTTTIIPVHMFVNGQKLQQMRAESQKEIADLKATVMNLQQELSFYQQPAKPAAGRSAKFTNRR